MYMVLTDLHIFFWEERRCIVNNQSFSFFLELFLLELLINLEFISDISALTYIKCLIKFSILDLALTLTVFFPSFMKFSSFSRFWRTL